MRRAVAIGGGTGLPRVLRCLLDLGHVTTAVVTMADDGGSSGHLRRELGMLPPGDVRNCIAAMSPVSTLARVFQYRFPHGEGLAGHALGNLMLAALADITGGFPAAIEAAERLLSAEGSVLPSTLEDIVLHAEDVHGMPIEGQALVARSDRIAHVWLEPETPAAYPPVLEAIALADAVVIAPGSLFTSVIPNLLVAGVTDAIRASRARCIYVCNVANQRGETSGMDAAGHVRALVAHGLEDALDVVVVDSAEGGAPSCLGEGIAAPERVEAGPDVCAEIESMGPKVVPAPLADADGCHHSMERLHDVLGRVL